MVELDKKILIDSGLSDDQTKIYLHLLEYGLSPAKIISTKTGIGRALTYKVLDQLVELELAEKREIIGKMAMFFPNHPSKIKDLAEKKKISYDEAISVLTKAMPQLSSSYNMLFGKPNVQFYEGLEGLRKVYDDILEIGQDILVISAPTGEGKENILHLVREQIEKQVAQNIKTKAITSHGSGATATPVSEDEKYLITRKMVPAEKLKIPAQIIIYGDKVAITNFKETIITVLMESKYIKDTFSTIFEYMWEKTE